jgi:hypothetical protein
MNGEPGDSTTLWGDRPMPGDGEILKIDVGPLTLWLKTVGDEIWLASARVGGEGPSPREGPPDDLAWSRWALRDRPHHLRILPVLPDRAMVVKPEHPFTLTRLARARVYMRVPTWVRVEAVDEAGGKPVRLAEVPTISLSDTWWGDFLDGEMAYWLTTKARRAPTPDLLVEKLLMRVEHLSIYEKDGRLWAEEVRVEYHGEAEGSDIHMDDHPPEEAKGAREITPPRTQSRSFKARTFARLRALSGFGL